ncbi:MAG: 50S ribosomal protein L23 [Oscillospiraceae bacterium]|jgi:large subunit ribosomal protein L23|nr:50S ribosomal protein L23 [Oscillospiraceae bacterium]
MADRTPQDIILRPVITERSTENLRNGKYTFRVKTDANKIEIKSAVEALFSGVKVDKVNTLHVRGRTKRRGRTEGKTSEWKKAIVTVTPDSKTIEFFEGMV